VVALLLLGVVIFYVSYACNKSEGVPLDLVYEEIPPE
jgi:hypothetical protein